jgi:hypothetical protein
MLSAIAWFTSHVPNFYTFQVMLVPVPFLLSVCRNSGLAVTGSRSCRILDVKIAARLPAENLPMRPPKTK